MKTLATWFLLLFYLLPLGVRSAEILTEKPKVTALFRGQNLDHWKPIHKEGWILDQGTLTPTGKHRKNNYIWTRNSYQDFVLTLQYKLSDGANSGVFIRSDPKNPVQGGIEVQLLDGPSKHALDGALDKHSNGAIYDAVTPSEYNNRPSGQWNSLLIYARGPLVTIYVNGNKVSTANLDHWTQAGQNPDGSKNKFEKALATLPQSGKIGLQYHGKPVWFRDINVTELDETSPDLTRLTARPPSSDDDLRFWLRNMFEFHNYSIHEAAAATGMTPREVTEARERFSIKTGNTISTDPNRPLLTMPYPGGRHPRIGFLDGAIDPQRETKLSVFLPWDPASYAVIDVPEAIVSNLGLMYLAHTHFPSIWTNIGVELEPLEWQRNPDSSFELTRTLPNDIAYTAKAVPTTDAIHFYISLSNGTSRTLTDLRLQNCVMLRGAPEFSYLTKENKILTNPYVAVHNSQKNRWMITAWEHCHNPWTNPNCPCMHSDPRLPDCPPGETVSTTGIFTFYQGTDIQHEFDRLEASGWREYFNKNSPSSQ